MYSSYVKRMLDIMISLFALLILSPVFIVVTVLVLIKLGSPVFFVQKRPGKNERIIRLIKYRTMTNEKNEDGELLPDEARLTGFGRTLRSTSIDELPELINILKGDMSLVGPRPQLVRDMVFMTPNQRLRHSVRPGLTGWAQVNGRNAIAWESKLQLDLDYIDKITFFHDVYIIFLTIGRVISRSGINQDGVSMAEDFGDYLLSTNSISQEEYSEKMKTARELLM